MSEKSPKNTKITKTAKNTDKPKTTRKKKAPKPVLFVPSQDATLPLPEEGATKSKMGAPVKFSPEKAIELMQAEITRYINGKMHTYTEIELGSGEKTQSRIKSVAPPTLIDIALKCGVTSDHLSRECNAKNEDGSIKNEHLYRTYKQYKEMCLMVMLKGGLTGDYQSNVVQFLANVNHNMVPKTEVEQTVEVKGMGKVYEELDSVYSNTLSRMASEEKEMQARKARLDQLGGE